MTNHGDCYDQIPFPGLCGYHAKKKCFKEMLSKNITRRFLSCDCINREHDKSAKGEDEAHICNCLRAVAGVCVPDGIA
ncbi:unnamed protein product [Eruca vesicaria subsp. sativa]|uniref:Uncharacterized protein n=1 Tax=Eruca vesicaria subsp. sativa TaxID=29727 RepID=A0ABC8L9V7_ERUVS|nr:unnamed protein product [Eruca vesicaria subsp. sativa]